MATTTAPAPVQVKKGNDGLVIPSANLVERVNEIFGVTGDGGSLKSYNVERDDEIELCALALIAAVDPLLLGDPGTGKTWLIEMILRSFAGDLNLFDIMVMKEMGADELIGPRSIPAMKDGRVERVIEGFLPTAHIGYTDEVFKGSPPVLNALLDLQANRQLKVGGKRIDAGQLMILFGSSNELPDREDLNAFRDRWGITKMVNPVRTPDGKRRVLEIQHQSQMGTGHIDFSAMPKLSQDELHQARAEAMNVDPTQVYDAIIEAQEKWEAAGHPPSQRRIGQIMRVMKARAWMRGRGELLRDDLIVTQHMAWNHPDHAQSAHDIALNFANRFNRRAMEARAALEPIMTDMSDIMGKISLAGGDQEEIDKHLEVGFKIINRLRRQRREVNSWIDEGRNQAEDVRELDKVLEEIDAAKEHAEASFKEQE